MSNEEKIAILKEMRWRFENDHPRLGLFGFCFAYNLTVGLPLILDSGAYADKSLLSELGLKEPKRRYSEMYWYSPGNKALRIRKIDQAIRGLSI